jgi:hypothetical protein
MKHTTFIDHSGLDEMLRPSKVLKLLVECEELTNENERLRAALKSHMQSGCNCAFCKDAELALDVKK